MAIRKTQQVTLTDQNNKDLVATLLEDGDIELRAYDPGSDFMGGMPSQKVALKISPHEAEQFCNELKKLTAITE